MVNDPIGDLLIRLKNSYERKHKKVEILYSKFVISVLEILKKEGFINDFEVIEDEKRKKIVANLRYDKNLPAIRNVKRVSKPGARYYVGYKDIPRVLNGIGICIISTSKGVMTGDEAKKQKIGGEFLCKIF